MTREWYFTFNDLSWHNLWDLIRGDASFTDPTFGKAPFVPDQVNYLKYDIGTGAGKFYVSDSKEEANGFSFTSEVMQLGSLNVINLRNKYFRTDTIGSQLHVAIAAR